MKKIIYFIILILINASCVEKIVVELDETYTRLVVDGAISTDSSKFTVKLTKTADYFYNAPIPVVPGAKLTISDGENSINLIETIEGKSGIYETDSSFSGAIGKSYTLDIDLAEPSGDHINYSASCQLMNVAKLDSIGIYFHEDWGEEGFWEIKCYAQEPGNEVNYYMFNLYRNGQLLSDTISKVSISDDKYFNGSYIYGLGAYYIDNSHPWERLNNGDVVTLQMSGITKEYFNYIMEVQYAGFNVPFFMGPPANVVGNINNGGIGFFAAYSNSYSSTVVQK